MDDFVYGLSLGVALGGLALACLILSEIILL